MTWPRRNDGRAVDGAPAILAPLLDALPACAAIIDRGGDVVATNEAWRRLAAGSSLAADVRVIARSARDVAAGTPVAAADGAADLGAGLGAVLCGERELFDAEHLLVIAGRQHRFRLLARRVVDAGFAGAMVLLVQHPIGEPLRVSAEHGRLLLEETHLEGKLLAAVLAQMPIGVMINEAPSGRLLLHNDQLAKLIGAPFRASASAPGLLSAGVRALHADGRPFDVAEYPLARALRGESLHDAEIEYERADRSRMILRVSAVPICDQPGRIIAAVVTFHDVTGWKHAERQLRESETRYRFVSRAIKDAIWDWDIANDRIDWSEGVMRRFGHHPDSVQPTIDWWLAQIHPSDRDRIHASFESALAGHDTIWQDDYRFRCVDGRWADVVDRGFIVRDEAGRAIRAVGAMEDVSERRRAEAERAALLEREQRARAEAEAANRAKDEFLAVVSHELRTPLAPILGFVDMLLEEDLDAGDERAALSAIERNARSLSHLIDDLLDVSRITSGKLALEFAPLSLCTLVAEVLESVRPVATAKSIRLTADLDDRRDMVAGDAARLTQVISNLLANAVKFTPRGGVVQVTVAGEQRRVVLAVRDNGKGIAPELLPYVFDRFRQGDTSDTRVHGGLGLGLAIARDIVELHGGAVRAQSDGDGQGATFTIFLPLVRAAHH